jgi:hypothetical protein
LMSQFIRTAWTAILYICIPCSKVLAPIPPGPY